MKKDALRLKLRFSNLVICDDIRLEVGNKRSLMGIFSGDIIVAEFPARIRLALYVEYRPPKGALKHDITVTLAQERDEGQVDMGTIKSAFDLYDPNLVPPLIMIFPQGLAHFPAPANLVVKGTVDNETVELARKKVVLGEVQPRPG